MSTARQELYDLAEGSSEDPSSSHQGLTKEDVLSAIHEYANSEKQEKQKAEQEKRQQALRQQNEQEHQALQEVASVVKTSLKEEMSKDKEFAKLVQSSELPGGLVEYIAEVGEPDEAPLIIRELANNDEYKETLKRSKTEVGVKRLIGKIRKDVLTGGTQGKIPPMLKKNIPHYNPNTSPSDYDQDYYSDLAMRHGI